MFLSEINGFKTRFHAYTVPGQVLYEDSRNLILKGVDGIVFVADSSIAQMEANLKSLEGLKNSLAEQGIDLNTLPWVIQYNKRDIKRAANVDEMQKLLNTEGVPGFETVATSGAGVFEAFRELAKNVIKDHAGCCLTPAKFSWMNDALLTIY